jgi:hypothetical protein
VGTEVARTFSISFPDKSDKRFIMFSTLSFSEASTGTSAVLRACNMCGRDAKKSVKRLDKPEYANMILVAAGSRQQAAGSRQQAAGSRQQAAGSRQQAAGSRQQANMKIFSVIQG